MSAAQCKNSYITNNLIGFSLVGVIIKVFFSSDVTVDGSSGPANASIWGYGVIACTIFTAMFLSFALLSNKPTLDNSIVEFIKGLVVNSLPSILTLIILVWILGMNMSYYKKINQGRVSEEYYQFSWISTLFIMIQLVSLLYLIQTQTCGGSNNSAKYVVYGATFINLIILSFMNTILKYFSTDG